MTDAEIQAKIAKALKGTMWDKPAPEAKEEYPIDRFRRMAVWADSQDENYWLPGNGKNPSIETIMQVFTATMDDGVDAIEHSPTALAILLGDALND